MRGLLLLADGFEDTEALTTRDVLVRAGLDIVTASISNSLVVTSSFGVPVETNTLLSNVFSFNNYDFLILPGGGRGTQNLKDSDLVKYAIAHFVANEKLVAAICAAPSILGKYGYLRNKRFTCFAGFELGYPGSFTGEEVVRDGNIITARSMMYSIPFALTIVEALLGNEVKEKVLTGLKGQTNK